MMKNRIVWIPIVLGIVGTLAAALVRTPSSLPSMSTHSRERDEARADSLGYAVQLPSEHNALPATNEQRAVAVQPGALPAAPVIQELEREMEGERDESPAPTLGGESRSEIVKALVASGAADIQWARRAATAVADLQRELPRDLGRELKFSKLECYARGCAWDVAYDSREAYDKSSQDFWRNSKLAAWPGVRARTQLEEPESGKLVATWLLLNPDPAGSSIPD